MPTTINTMDAEMETSKTLNNTKQCNVPHLSKMWSNLCLLKENLIFFVQIWTQSSFLWIVIAEVAETAEDTHSGDDSKQIGYDNTGTSTISEKVKNTM